MITDIVYSIHQSCLKYGLTAIFYRRLTEVRPTAKFREIEEAQVLGTARKSPISEG